MLRALLLLLAFGTFPLSRAMAELASDWAVPLTATVQASPRSIILTWSAGGDARSFRVERKSPDSSSWTTLAKLPASTLSYTDTAVSPGVEYEYRVTKAAHAAASSLPEHDYKGYGHISAGLDVALVEKRGRVILLVDSTQAAPLTAEIARLQQDLLGDGWTVTRHDVDRNAAPAAIRKLLKADAPTGTTALFLLGHVPVPYSGDFAPDGHAQHVGAWAADVFYGDLTGSWTDTTVNDSGSDADRTHNVPGDGKYDQSTIPGEVTLQIGRVDFADMPSFSASETELLRQYLNRDHAWRTRQLTVPRRGIIFDSFGVLEDLAGFYEAFSSNGLDYISALVGPAHVELASSGATWFDRLQNEPHLFAYASGDGQYTSVGSFASTGDFAAKPSQAVFTALLGSYFGDFDRSDDLLRAPLANAGAGLACVWAGRPSWTLHPLGMGHTLGYCAWRTQNSDETYPAGYTSANSGQERLITRGVHVALMGDPTLRLDAVAPPSALQFALSPDNTTVTLTWTAAPGSPEGYHVFRASSAEGPYKRVSAELLTGTTFTDSSPPAGAVYQVRAIHRESTNGGTYWNSSQGIFADQLPPFITLSTPVAATSAAGAIPAQVLFTRSGPAVGDLVVTYIVSGEAVAGADYQSLSGTVTIPDGQSSATVSIVPLATAAGSGRKLKLSVPLSSRWYRGTPSTATVLITGTENKYLPYRGTYRTGLALQDGRIGSLIVTTTAAGTFSGTLRVGSAVFAFTGTLDTLASFSADVAPDLHLDFSVAAPGGVLLLSGALRLTADGSTAATFSAGHDCLGALPPPEKGTWTFALISRQAPPDFTSADGAGYGLLKIGGTGTATFSGKLADGTTISVGTALSDTGRLLLVQGLAGPGVLTGELTFADVPETSDVAGTLTWQALPHPGTPLGSGGAVELNFIGCRYTPPPAGTRLLTLEARQKNGRLTAKGAGLDAPLQVVFTLGSSNTATGTSGSGLKMTVTPSTGFLQGSFRLPDSTTVAFTSVALQKPVAAFGYFKRAGAFGLVLIDSNPAQ